MFLVISNGFKTETTFGDGWKDRPVPVSKDFNVVHDDRTFTGFGIRQVTESLHLRFTTECVEVSTEQSQCLVPTTRVEWWEGFPRICRERVSFDGIEGWTVTILMCESTRDVCHGFSIRDGLDISPCFQKWSELLRDDGRRSGWAGEKQDICQCTVTGVVASRDKDVIVFGKGSIIGRAEILGERTNGRPCTRSNIKDIDFQNLGIRQIAATDEPDLVCGSGHGCVTVAFHGHVGQRHDRTGFWIVGIKRIGE
mmetsp:Transcript_34425/g.79475  ORF Transcript_34425/g.79475 Transcript_34425/m.79475 type:complete len:253 (-) Transcript_34425:265-1023(-)